MTRRLWNRVACGRKIGMCGYIGYRLFLCASIRLGISPPRIKIAASNFSRRFIGVQGRDHIFCELCSLRSQKPQVGQIGERAACPPSRKHYRTDAPVDEYCSIIYADINVTIMMRRSWNRAACWHRIGMRACIRPSAQTDVLVLLTHNYHIHRETREKIEIYSP